MPASGTLTVEELATSAGRVAAELVATLAGTVAVGQVGTFAAILAVAGCEVATLVAGRAEACKEVNQIYNLVDLLRGRGAGPYSASCTLLLSH